MIVKILVACHKFYEIPKSSILLPIEVGAANRSEHFFPTQDNMGENISNKNSSYCELTALYWAWKNLDCDIIGLNHYRRYFSSKRKILNDNIKNIINENQILKLLKKYDFILPRLTKMKITNYDHGNYYYDFGETEIFNDHHFDITREVIKKYYPDYLNTFDLVMKRKCGHFLNMFITKKDVADKYFEWLFDILRHVEEIYVFDNPFPSSKRVFGYIAENLLDVFIIQNNFTYIERDLIYLERTSLIKRLIRKIKISYLGGKNV